MPDAFEIIARFLDHYAAEVEGRAHEELPVEIRERLQRFARGALSDTEREGLIAELRRHPAWEAVLAEEVKALRGTGDDVRPE